jgi:hypothetical protein
MTDLGEGVLAKVYWAFLWDAIAAGQEPQHLSYGSFWDEVAPISIA